METQKIQSKSPELIDVNKIIIGVGFIAILFPLGVYLPSLLKSHNCHDDGLLHSISAYYHSSSRDVFIGMICALAFCFTAYKGYNKFESNLANVAAWCALGVGFIPTRITEEDKDCLVVYGSRIQECIHVACAASLLIVLAYFPICLFTIRRPNDLPITPRKKFLYLFYGYAILVSIILIAVYIFLLEDNYPRLKACQPIFWLESVALVSFGCSWLVKSKLFEKNKEITQEIKS